MVLRFYFSHWFLQSVTILILLISGNTKAREFNICEVADGVFLHQGIHVAFTDPQSDDIANIGFIIGTDCIAVIDTGGSIEIAQSLLTAIRKVSQLPVCYVINTHVHFDHVLGNAVFVEENSEFIGHQKLADAIAGSRNFFLQQFAENLKLKPSIIAPDRGVADRLTLNLGGRELLLQAYQTAHSDTDLTVLDMQTNTLWAGDLIFRQRIPALEGSLTGWIEVIEKLSKEKIALVIPGHGDISSDWPTGALQPQQQYLHTLLNETRAAIAKGAFLEQVLETVGNKQKTQWLLHEQHHRRNVSKAFSELEWE